MLKSDNPPPLTLAVQSGRRSFSSARACWGRLPRKGKIFACVVLLPTVAVFLYYLLWASPMTNVARDLAQFSARFGRPLTYKLSKLAHYMQSPEKNFSGPLYLCFGFRIRLHLQPQAFAP